jgi:hypothetical protein
MSLANLGLALGIMAARGMLLLLRKSFATTGWKNCFTGRDHR